MVLMGGEGGRGAQNSFTEIGVVGFAIAGTGGEDGIGSGGGGGGGGVTGGGSGGTANGNTGIFLQGGAGGEGIGSEDNGSGGGGGYYGGGGGGGGSDDGGFGGGGGGGGSSYYASSVEFIESASANNGNNNGRVTLTYEPNPICYVKGTKILTQSGYVKIEDLQPNDMVVTNGTIHNTVVQPLHSLQPIKWKGHFRTQIMTHDTRPICIKADAFGTGAPFEDLYVSPGHRIARLTDDNTQTIIQACYLVNGTTIIRDTSCSEVTYYHIELDQHSTVIANGIDAESYEDVNNRATFTHVASV